MAAKEHRYSAKITWTGNLGTGTSSYTGYSRDHVISFNNKPPLNGSSDPAFRGDPSRYNPEELLVSALSTCHMLWYLHLCADAGIVVISYEDDAGGTMREGDDMPGGFSEVVLRPRVGISNPQQIALAKSLHEKAHAQCFIANSVNFPVLHEPTVFAN